MGLKQDLFAAAPKPEPYDVGSPCPFYRPSNKSNKKKQFFRRKRESLLSGGLILKSAQTHDGPTMREKGRFRRRQVAEERRRKEGAWQSARCTQATKSRSAFHQTHAVNARARFATTLEKSGQSLLLSSFHESPHLKLIISAKYLGD